MALLLTVAAPLFGRADDMVANCDRLAASANDKTVGVAGVEFEALDGAAARLACREAWAARPDLPRLAFQLGRAEQKLGNYDAAMQDFKMASDGGYRLADVAIGFLHDHGLGVPADHAKAAEFYRRAADAGLGVGLKNLADLQAQGLGVPKDADGAMALYRRAAADGYVAAYGALADVLAESYEDGGDPGPVLDAYLTAVAKGVASANTELGHFYIDARFGLPLDPVAARAHYEAGAAGGDPWAGLYLAQMLAFGRDATLRNVSRAQELLAGLMAEPDATLKAQAMAFLAELRLQQPAEEKQAAKLIEEALALAPADGFVQSALARLLLRSHDTDGADAALVRAIAADPEWAPFYQQRARLLEELRQIEKAQELRAAADRASLGGYFLEP